ncbi:MAG: TFIIB-type zinc ribbon-containing protein [Clostridiales bacterium]|nr:TFIIB-type zinc ribbon-containing protein [Clostridiales bacterium]
MSWEYDTVDSIAASSAKCPNCSANIFFNEKIGKLVCSFCGGIYEPQTLAPTGSIANRDTGEAGDEENNKQEFICDSCGATVVTDCNTSATFCAFCGSATLIQRRLRREFRPDLLIPFKISKEDAIKNYREWVKTHRGVPKAFREEATLEKITGFYVPFWLIDAECSTVITGEGMKRINSDTSERYNIERTVDFKMKRVPFDGCKKISNLLMEAIEPFDYSELVPYNDMFLPGFYAQRYDTSALDMLDLISIRFNSYAMNLVKKFSASEYSSVTVRARGSHAGDFSQLYALLPVWFLNINYKGLNYSIAVNGQTGETSGNLPVNKRAVFEHSLLKAGKIVLTYILFMLLISVPISYFIFKPLGWPYVTASMLVINVILAGIGPFVYGPFVAARYHRNKNEESVTLDQAPDMEEYMDYQSKINMENNDMFVKYTNKTTEAEEIDPLLMPKGGARNPMYLLFKFILRR